MPSLFLSYRRADRHAAGLLRAEIARRIGESRVFMDVRDVPIGEGFPDEIASALSGARSTLALIGSGWIAEQDRLHEPDDWVRREIETAIAGESRVIPVLLDDLELPPPDTLPDSLHTLPTLQAYRVGSDHLVSRKVD